MRHPLVKALIVLEVLVCFGPIALVVVLGAVFSPVWVTGLIKHFTSDTPAFGSEGMPWDALWPMLVVIGGILGLIGLIRVTAIVLSGAPNNSGRTLTIYLVASGLAAIGLFDIVMTAGFLTSDFEAGDMWGLIPGAMVYIVLPGLGSAHLLYLARHSLFGCKRGRGETLTGSHTAA